MTMMDEAKTALSKTGLFEGRAPVNVNDQERAMSLAAGAVAVVLGLSRVSLPGLILAGLGAGLLSRGATGHCPAYKKLGINTAEPQ